MENLVVTHIKPMFRLGFILLRICTQFDNIGSIYLRSKSVFTIDFICLLGIFFRLLFLVSILLFQQMLTTRLIIKTQLKEIYKNSTSLILSLIFL